MLLCFEMWVVKEEYSIYGFMTFSLEIIEFVIAVTVIKSFPIRLLWILGESEHSGLAGYVSISA